MFYTTAVQASVAVASYYAGYLANRGRGTHIEHLQAHLGTICEILVLSRVQRLFQTFQHDGSTNMLLVQGAFRHHRYAGPSLVTAPALDDSIGTSAFTEHSPQVIDNDIWPFCIMSAIKSLTSGCVPCMQNKGQKDISKHVEDPPTHHAQRNDRLYHDTRSRTPHRRTCGSRAWAYERSPLESELPPT